MSIQSIQPRFLLVLCIVIMLWSCSDARIQTTLVAPKGSKLLVEYSLDDDGRVTLFHSAKEKVLVWRDPLGQNSENGVSNLIDSIRWVDDDCFVFQSELNAVSYKARRVNGVWAVSEKFD